MVKVIECPRDAMQGMNSFIPTRSKAKYINQLLKVGFDTIDFGSFVSPKAIPQMKDTLEVFENLDKAPAGTKLLAIVANTRGGEEACRLAGIDYLGFPLSISETFQKRNTNKSISEALNTLNELMNLCEKSDKTLVTYLSMGFGNPYGDPYESNMVVKFSEILRSIGVGIISIADTIGIATSSQVSALLQLLNKEFGSIVEFGVHLHSNPISAREKVEAAYDAGCRRFDGALLGFGGCPMAADALVGNIDTSTVLDVLLEKGYDGIVRNNELTIAKQIASEIFIGG